MYRWPCCWAPRRVRLLFITAPSGNLSTSRAHPQREHTTALPAAVNGLPEGNRPVGFEPQLLLDLVVEILRTRAVGLHADRLDADVRATAAGALTQLRGHGVRLVVDRLGADDLLRLGPSQPAAQMLRFPGSSTIRSMRVWPTAERIAASSASKSSSCWPRGADAMNARPAGTHPVATAARACRLLSQLKRIYENVYMVPPASHNHTLAEGLRPQRARSCRRVANEGGDVDWLGESRARADRIADAAGEGGPLAGWGSMRLGMAE